MKISVSTWSLHHEMPHIQGKHGPYKTQLLDFPKVCVDEFGVYGAELCYQHFPTIDWDYLHQVEKSLDEFGVTLVNIPVDISSAAESDPEKRKQDFERIRRWFYIAKYLGSPSIRVNAGRGTDEAALERAIEGYTELVGTAEKTGVKLLIENHGGISSNPDNILTIIKEVGSKYLGTCPDFGNFPEEIRYEGLEKVAKYASILHAKTYDFDEQGETHKRGTPLDFKRCVDIFKRQGYNGYYSIEYEGTGEEHEGVKKSVALLKKYL
ncbi:MAG: sugar phosphate isomerase/epimerase [Candidatus Bathyarchaeota archaeon]|nr:sugar phosphate isomerase/epimerase [Candidatus Bathyarchaeota archaeon]